MLINCPKCGFSQPKDRYCASCGVDMETFRPAKPSLLKQIWVSPVFLIGLTLAIVMASVYFIRQKQGEEIAARAELIRSGPVIVESSAPAPPPATQAATPAPTATPTDSTHGIVAAASSTSPQPAAAPAAKPASTEGDAKADAKPDAKTAAAHKITMTVTYAEVSKPLLAQLEEESQETGQFTDFGEFKAGALSDPASQLRGVKVLQKITKTFDGKTSQQKWFVGRKTQDEQDLGLTALVSLDPSNDGHIHGEIEILRSLYESQDAEEVGKKSYPTSSFDLPAKGGWMIQLKDLPRTVQRNAGYELGGDGFLHLFKEGSFQKGDTEFTLILEFDNPNP